MPVCLSRQSRTVSKCEKKIRYNACDWVAFGQSVVREGTARTAPRAVDIVLTILPVILSLDTVIAVCLAGNHHCVNMVGVVWSYTTTLSFCDNTCCLVIHYSIIIPW